MKATWGLMAAAMLAAGGLSLPAAAQDSAAPSSCTFTNSNSDTMDVVLRTYGARLTDYATFCQRMGQDNLGVDVSEFANSGNGDTSAVVILRLYDLASQVRAQESVFAVSSLPGEADELRGQVLSSAYDAALQAVASNMDRHVASVQAEVARLRQLYQGSVAPPVAPAEAACTITNTATPVMVEAMDRWGGFPDFAGYDGLCAALRARGMGLALSGGTSLQDGQLVGWAAATGYDLATRVMGDGDVTAVGSARDADEGDLDDAQYEGLRIVLEMFSTEQDSLLAKVDEAVSAQRTYFTPTE